MKPRPITDAEREFLVSAWAAKTPIRRLAASLDVCTDTLKRILVREGIASFPGAKYALSTTRDQKLWTRPCLSCGSTQKRPRLQFRCDSCHAATDGDGDDYTYTLYLG